MARTGSTVGCRFGIILCIFVAFLVSEIGGRRLLHGLEKLMTACAGYDGFCLVIEFERDKVIRFDAQNGKRLSEGRDEDIAAGHAIICAAVWQADLPFTLDQIGYKRIQ